MSYLKFFLFNILLLVMGGYGLNLLAPPLERAIKVHPDDFPLWTRSGPAFIHDLSHALTIAVFLNLLVEWFIRTRDRQLQQELVEHATTDINSELLRTVFKRNLPERVVEQIEAQLFSGGICKIMWEATYYLELGSDPNDANKPIVVWTANDKYTLKNMDRRKREHEIAIEMEVTRHYELFSRMAPLQIDGDAVKCDTTQNGSRVRLTHKIVLDPGEEIEVVAKQAGAGPIEYHEVICSLLPVEDLRVTVIHSKELQVSALSLHPEPEEFCENQPNQKTWHMQGIFPGQGLDIIWSMVDYAQPITPLPRRSGQSSSP